MTTQLTADPLILREKFYKLKTFEDVAELLEIKAASLIYYLYGLQPSKKYSVFSIPKKSGGKREIHSPCPAIKILQTKLLQVLETVYIPRDSTHAFVENRSVVTNAQSHLKYGKRSYVFNIDLKDFYPSINFGRVRGLFIKAPYSLSEDAATVIAQLCCFNNQLPQGAPSSPIISNMICARLDRELQNLAKEHKCFYSRYADDITFSTTLKAFPKQLAFYEKTPSGLQLMVGEKLNSVIKSNGFQINERKVHLKGRDRRQQITGITINDKLNTDHKYIKQIRAMLYAWSKDYEKAQAEHTNKWRPVAAPHFKFTPSFASVVRGKIEYLGMVRGHHDKLYQDYLGELKQLDAKLKSHHYIPPREKIFISYSHKDKKHFEEFLVHLKPLEEKGLLYSWHDRKISPGDDWRKEISAALNTSKAAILLISPDFLASNFIMHDELPVLRQAAINNEIKLFPICVRYASFEYLELGDIQAINNPEKPLSTLSPAQRDKEFQIILKKIQEHLHSNL